MEDNKLNIAKNLDQSSKIELTKEGKKELEDKLQELLEVERPKIQEELAEARAQGDLSENADYDAAKNKQAEIESEIERIKDTLSRAEVIITAKNNNEVRIGKVITYKKDRSNYKIIIVPEVEYDPLAEIPKVGVSAPIAVALMGKKIGEKTKVETDKPYMIEIISIN